jgi:hypothetical protein
MPKTPTATHTKKPAAPAIERPHKNLTKTQEEFAGVESCWLFNEVLGFHNAGEDIVEEFCRIMDLQEVYVRVPWQHKKRIEEFVAFLEKERAA